MNSGGRRLTFVQLAICLLLITELSGCSGPLVVSQRFLSDTTGIAADRVAPCDEPPCHCRDILAHVAECAGRANRLIPGSDADRGLVPVRRGEEGVEAPHPKFHPVPTSPVFAPRDVDSGSGLEPTLTPTSEPELLAPGLKRLTDEP